MNTNHDALREALEPFAAIDLTQSGVPANFAELVLRARIALYQPMPEAAAQGWKPDYSKEKLNAFAQALYDEKMREGKHGHYETMFHVIHQSIAHLFGEVSASPAAPEGAKPCNYPDCKCPTETPCLQGRAQPQAQAGKPEVVAWCALNFGGKSIAHFEGKPMVMCGPAGNEHHPVALITLQSHREAIAKRDAALVACVEEMSYMRSVASFERNKEIDAAITQAAKPEQQAQAGEPEALYEADIYGELQPLRSHSVSPGDKFITLQSHREAIAKRDAALQALIDETKDAATSLETVARLAGKASYVGDDGERIPTYMEHHDQVRGYAASRAGVARAAITQANEALGRKEG